jgi:hypothetical protein
VTQFGPVDEQEHEPEQDGWRRARPVLLATLVPIAAAAGFFALATYGKRSADVTQEPSMAAFDACLTANGLQPAGQYPTQFDATVAAQQQMKVCGDKIPKAVLQKAADRQRAAMASYRECLRNIGGSGGTGGYGRYGGPSKSFREAFSICRSLLGGGGPAPAPKPSTTPDNVA